MTGLPKVTVEKKNGALGGVEPSNDGEALLVVGSVGLTGSVSGTPQNLAYPDVFNVYANVEEFLADYPEGQQIDIENGMLFAHHIIKFFEASGSKLHVMRVDKVKTLTQLLTTTDSVHISLRNYLEEQNGAIKLIGFAQNPVVIETSTDGVSADLVTAIAKAQEFVDYEFNEGRPIHILLEGRNVSFTSSTLVDLRGQNAAGVSVVAWQNLDIANSIGESYVLNGNEGGQQTPALDFVTDCTKYAEIGYTLGLVSSQPVQRNVGRVRNGQLLYTNKIASSSGQLVQNIAKTVRDTVAEKGYIFARKHPQLDGWYISDDPTCTAKTDDYAWITRTRTINKAAIITRRVYNQSILDEVYVDPDTGLLSALTIKNFEADVENAINLEMIRNGEATAVEAYVDPAQDVLTTGEIVVDIRIVPIGVARYIIAKVGFSKVI